MNDVYKKLFFIVSIICVLFIIAFIWAASERNKALGELAGSNQLIERYRSIDAETARANRQLADRLERVQNGLGDIRNLTSGGVKNIQSAIGIIAGVKSILEKMEEGGFLRDTALVGSGAGERIFNGE